MRYKYYFDAGKYILFLIFSYLKSMNIWVGVPFYSGTFMESFMLVSKLELFCYILSWVSSLTKKYALYIINRGEMAEKTMN